MPSLELKRCPFCGGPAVLEEIPAIASSEEVRFSVGCTDDDGGVMCMGYQSLTTFPTRREAVDAWNKRAE